MALFAERSERKISALDAKEKHGYTCLLCKHPVILKKGTSKVPHFSHKKLSPSCKQKKRSSKHLELQLQIQSLFPEAEVTLEVPFYEIQRVADLVWEKEGIIFELQLSPLTKEEALRRERDYASIGYEVVWLLGDKTFNRRKGKEAEIQIRKKTSYYISLKTGQIYDQIEHFHGRIQEILLPRRAIYLQKPQKIEDPNTFSSPLKERATRSKICFLNDYLSTKPEKIRPPYSQKKYLKRSYHNFLKKLLRLLESP